MDDVNVLVVEDDVALARNIAMLLSPLSVRAQIATSCHDALELARTTRFEVVILDLVLPDGDGLTLAPLLDEHSPDVEIVYVTGQATLDHAVQVVGQRAAALLLKPFAPARLVTTVEGALARRRASAHAFESRVRESRYRTLSRLSDGLAHELRNPLNGALLQLELVLRQLRRDSATSEDVLHHLAGARSELHRLTETLTEFECCVRPSAPALEQVAAEELVACALARLERLARTKGVAIVRDVEPDLVVEVDPVAMARVLRNLAENGIEAMPDGGTLHVRARTDGDHAVIEVEDEGVGIPDVTAVFDPFFSSKSMGTGLGLNVVERVVADHQGTLAVRSRKGSTTFTITLPAGSPP